MNDAERQGRIGELLRVAILQAEFKTQIEERLTMLGEIQHLGDHQMRAQAREIQNGLGEVAALIAPTSTDRWAGWVIYMLQVLENEANPVAFAQFLGALQHDLGVRLAEGRW